MDGCADGKEDYALTPVILLEHKTQETIKEMEELQITRDRESTMVLVTTVMSEVCSTMITKDVEESGDEKLAEVVIAAAVSPGGFDEDVEGDTVNRAKMDQGAGIRSILAEDDASTSDDYNLFKEK